LFCCFVLEKKVTHQRIKILFGQKKVRALYKDLKKDANCVEHEIFLRNKFVRLGLTFGQFKESNSNAKAAVFCLFCFI